MTQPSTKLPRAELLAPAGSPEKLKAAIDYGADAVYLGTPDLSLRSRSEFTLEEVAEGIVYAHARGRKVYLTLNLFSHNDDIERLPQALETLKEVQPDGVIVADPGIFQLVQEQAPELPLHISTQANVCSWLSVKFWERQGAALCVLAREVSFKELREIREHCPDIALEAFVHGSMCMTYSGRCLLSNFMAERGANQGNCANSCRWTYKVHFQLKDGTLKELEINQENEDLFDFFLEEECRPGELLPIVEDRRGSYIMNSKDLCLMPKLDELLSIGIDSLKIEGRNKSLYYVAITTRAYRMAIDAWYRDPESWNPAPYMNELNALPNRGYTLAFHEGRLTDLGHNYHSDASLSTSEFAGIIHTRDAEGIVIAPRNRLIAGEVVEFVSPIWTQPILLRLYDFTLAAGGEVREVVHGGTDQHFYIPYSVFDRLGPERASDALPVGTVLRKERHLNPVDKSRMGLDKTALNVELGRFGQNVLTKRRSEYLKTMERNPKEAPRRGPQLGIDGCCGKGCNGCLIFAHDPAYAKARRVLAEKPIGEMFQHDMRE